MGYAPVPRGIFPPLVQWTDIWDCITQPQWIHTAWRTINYLPPWPSGYRVGHLCYITECCVRPFHQGSLSSNPYKVPFLALLDYASRAHEIVICPSSVVSPSVTQLSLNLMGGFLSNFGCCFPWAIRPKKFWNFEKNFFYFFTNIFRFR